MKMTVQAEKQTPVEEICLTIKRSLDQYKMALPPHVPVNRFIRIAVTAIRQTPELALCDRGSLYGSLMRCAQDGLLPNAQEAAIVAWGNRARYLPMVSGLCKKARNSGEIISLDAAVVYENDSYVAWTDEKGPHFRHEKSRENRGSPILTYAYATTKDGGFYFEEIVEEEMNKIESLSKGKDSPWKGPFRDEMKRKSAIRRLAKYRLPSSTDLDSAISAEDDIYERHPQEDGVKPASLEPKTLLKKLIENSKPKTIKPPDDSTEVDIQQAQEESPI